MINADDVRQNYHNKPVLITLASKIILHGVIIYDTADYCRFVKNPNLIEYKETKRESLVEKIYFKDIKAIDHHR